MLELDEDCLSKILSFTDPREVCRLSIVSPDFNRAALSDAVWDEFLPPDYSSLISSSSSPSLLSDLPSKKHLYLSLSDSPILIDDGKTSFSLDKGSGKKILMISARSLSIVWGDTPNYWEWNSDTESRFGETAELIDVCWLEITGRIKTRMLSATTMYGIYLVYKLRQRVHGFKRRHPPLQVAVGVVDSAEAGKRECRILEGKKRGDGWLELELGEFFNDKDGQGDLEVSIKEIKGGHWKSGLVVQALEFRSKKQ